MSADRRASDAPPRAIRSVGLVAKARLREAAGLLREIAGWLDERGVTAVFEEETAAIADPVTGQPPLSKDVLPMVVDMSSCSAVMARCSPWRTGSPKPTLTFPSWP